MGFEYSSVRRADATPPSACVDAWGHLGLIAFHTRGPGPARRFYETAVGIAERSLPTGFGGVLSWGMVDNRPFFFAPSTGWRRVPGGSGAGAKPRRYSPSGFGSTHGDRSTPSRVSNRCEPTSDGPHH